MQKVYISLTSIYQNQNELLLTLKSIKDQSHKPDQVFIYLSEEPYLLDEGFKNKTITNKNLYQFIDENKNLFTIIWVNNTGPYRKLLPILKSKWNENCIIITIDDDTIYDQYLIENMIADYKENNCIITYRGFTMIFDSFETIKYFDRDNSIPKNLYNYFTGKGGVLYHPSFFYKTGNLIFDENLYMDLCSTTDDIWFNLVRICNGINCYYSSYKYMISDHSTKFALFTNYNSYVQNDLDLNTINMRKTAKKLIELGYMMDKI